MALNLIEMNVFEINFGETVLSATNANTEVIILWVDKKQTPNHLNNCILGDCKLPIFKFL